MNNYTKSGTVMESHHRFPLATLYCATYKFIDHIRQSGQLTYPYELLEDFPTALLSTISIDIHDMIEPNYTKLKVK